MVRRHQGSVCSDQQRALWEPKAGSRITLSLLGQNPGPTVFQACNAECGDMVMNEWDPTCSQSQGGVRGGNMEQTGVSTDEHYGGGQAGMTPPLAGDP